MEVRKRKHHLDSYVHDHTWCKFGHAIGQGISSQATPVTRTFQGSRWSHEDMLRNLDNPNMLAMIQ